MACKNCKNCKCVKKENGKIQPISYLALVQMLMQISPNMKKK